MNIQELFDNAISEVKEDDVMADVDSLKHEYVRDWEDEFDDIHEAYEEQGRGEAEAQVLGEIVQHYVPVMYSKDYLDLYDRLKEHWCL